MNAENRKLVECCIVQLEQLYFFANAYFKTVIEIVVEALKDVLETEE